MIDRQPIRGRNFRLSEQQLAELDSLVAYFNRDPDRRLVVANVNRSDVLRYLIRQECAKIEAEALRKMELEMASKKKPASAISRRKNNVMKRGEK
jgi:Arc/MetJ-type ribon-helix-helix transcriptional regulator